MIKLMFDMRCWRTFNDLPMDLTQYHFLCFTGRIVFLGEGGDAEQQTQQNDLKSVGYY